MAAVERLATGFRWAEGPVWFGDGRYLLWSDIPNNRIMRWDEETGAVSVFRKPSNFANGNTRDRQGRLVTCEHDSRRVTRTEYDGTITVVLDRFDGKPLNSPNDVVVKSDDSIWFTDPPFGILSNYEGHTAPRRAAHQRVPRRRQDGRGHGGDGRCVPAQWPVLFARRAAALRRGERRNPARDPRLRRLRRRDQRSTAAASSSTAARGFPTASAATRTAISGAAGAAARALDGVAVFNPDGKLIGRILLPERCANLCFGGAKRNRLFMAGSQSVYSVYVNAQGATLS